MMGANMEKSTSMTIVMVGSARERLPMLEGVARELGYTIIQIASVTYAPSFVLAGGVRAVLVGAARFGYRDLAALQACRKGAPKTRIIIVSDRPSKSDLMLALESGATTFLSAPVSEERLREVLGAEG
jgi:DNA-binding NtrC family response regulator